MFCDRQCSVLLSIGTVTICCLEDRYGQAFIDSLPLNNKFDKQNLCQSCEVLFVPLMCVLYQMRHFHSNNSHNRGTHHIHSFCVTEIFDAKFINMKDLDKLDCRFCILF